MQRNTNLPSCLDASRVTPDCACHSLSVLGSYLNSLQPNRTSGHGCYQSYPECSGKARVCSTHTATEWDGQKWRPTNTLSHTHTNCALLQLHAQRHRHTVTEGQKCRHTHHHRQTDTHTHTVKDTHTETYQNTDRQTNSQTQKHTCSLVCGPPPSYSPSKKL